MGKVIIDCSNLTITIYYNTSVKLCAPQRKTPEK